MVRVIYSRAVFLVLIAIAVAWTMFILYISPEQFVSWVGINNAYALAFLFAAIGGLTTITGYSFVATLLALAAGGADPILLGLSGGLGIFISDSVFYFIAQYGVKTFAKETSPITSWLVTKTKSWPEWALKLGVYMYVSFTPFPNDALMIAVALHGFSYRKFAPVLFVGSITLVTLTAYLGAYLGGLI